MRDTCFYDGRCGLCRRSVTWLRRLDWLSRLEIRDLHTAPDLPVSLDLARTGMPMRTRDGRVLVGFPALRRALRQTPVGCLPALILYIPGIAWLGRAGYRWVADHRPQDACALHPVPTIAGNARPVHDNPPEPERGRRSSHPGAPG